MAKKNINVEQVKGYLGRKMYEKTAAGWKYIHASKGIEGFENKAVWSIMLPIAEAMLQADYGKRAGIENSVSNRKVIEGLYEVCKYLGISEDKTGEPIKFLGCDANAWKKYATKGSTTGMEFDTAGKQKIVKTTMEVIGKRYRRMYYTANGEIK